MPIHVQRDPDLYNAGWSKPHLPQPLREACERPVLSPRETEVLTLLAAGCTRPEVARRLVIAMETVRAHCVHIFEKLGAHTAAEAVAEGIRRGLIE